MNPILFWLIALVALAVLWPVVRLATAAIFGSAAADDALAQQPDAIHLRRSDFSLWKKPDDVAAYVEVLRGRGFEDAGIHWVTEMPGLAVQLLAHPGDHWIAVVYEHPAAGVWLDLAAQFQDGDSFTLSTSRPSGLDPRPGHTMIHAHGMDANEALAKAMQERPRKWCSPTPADQAVAIFETAYAESIAYRKQKGISRREVMKVATRKVA